MSRDFTKNTVVVIPTSKPIVISHFLHATHIFWVFRLSAVKNTSFQNKGIILSIFKIHYN